MNQRWWTPGGAVVVLLVVAACAPTPTAAQSPDTGFAVSSQPAATTTTPVRRASRSAATAGSAAARPVDPACTRATAVRIGRSSFSPRRLTIQRGGFLAVTNVSTTVHTLVTRPNAGIVTSILDRRERQVIQFPQKGTFAVRSAAAAGAVLRVTVAGESGCGTTKPSITIGIGNTVRPARLALVATQNFAVVNTSGTAQAVRCTPDPGGNGDNSRLEPGETQLLAIDKPGRYRCGSVQHPTARATLTVTDP
jgi:plastocyanin